MTLPHTQPQRPVSGFAIATLVLPIMAIVLPAMIAGSSRWARSGAAATAAAAGDGAPVISAAWVFLVAAYQSLAREGETRTTAAMVTYALDQIDQARIELNAISK